MRPGCSPRSARLGRRLGEPRPFGVRTSDSSGLGLPSTYLFAGQRAWVEYELTIEGDGGGLLITFANWVPHRDGILIRRLTTSGGGRIELVAPRVGF